MSTETNERELPKCVSIVICNEVIEDKRTNNKSLIGLFNSIHVAQSPTSHPRMFVFASLMGGSGKWPVTLVIRDTELAEIARIDGEVIFNSPLDVLDIVIELNMLPLPQLGTYFVDLQTGSEILGGRRFTVFSGQNPQQEA